MINEAEKNSAPLYMPLDDVLMMLQDISDMFTTGARSRKTLNGNQISEIILTARTAIKRDVAARAATNQEVH